MTIFLLVGLDFGEEYYGWDMEGVISDGVAVVLALYIVILSMNKNRIVGLGFAILGIGTLGGMIGDYFIGSPLLGTVMRVTVLIGMVIAFCGFLGSMIVKMRAQN